ncbi:hypothetical protein PLEOSDRAFT_1085497 [Pleurotus ostreatus PC15]|uniref:Protein kinase domain-containing protein n=1 Tax=Pleurotus ostreatus (strain PC15) TaxID=1137138 RepID=A0A067NKV7_PLEO1|nr:hypothetical protein PLEOSDRAFT_1085497 [Pleurotus ostreatus PC15]
MATGANKRGILRPHGLVVITIDFSEPPFPAQENNPRKLRDLKLDWRDVRKACSGYATSAPLSFIKKFYNYPENSPRTNNQAFILSQRNKMEPGGADRPSVAAAIQAHMTSPSTSAKNEQLMMTEHENVPEAVYDGRPANLIGPSITIYHPIFSEFKHKLNQLPAVGEIPPSDLQMALLFVDTSARYFSDEGERHRALCPFVVHFLGGSFDETTIVCGKTTMRLDGHRRARCGLLSLGYQGRDAMLVCLEELNNGIGLGNVDPVEQAAKGYVLMSTQPELAELRMISCMPSFLLGIAGPFIAVSGAIYVNGVISQRLTDMICVVADSSSSIPPEGFVSEREKHIYKIAHLFRTLRWCLDKLSEEYEKLSSTRSDHTVVPAPHFTAFRALDSRDFTLTYQERFFDSRSHRAVFLAQAKSDDGASLLCVVKFTSRYCREAHELVQAVGGAPKLLYCTFEPSVGKFCVVTEYIEGSRKPSAADKDKVVDAMKNAMKTLHDNAYVFGDLRSANIIIDRSGRPYLIDFDWCGKEGAVFYPTDLNTSGIEWAAGVEGGGEIRKAHDEWMLQTYIDELQSLMDVT